MIRRLFYQLRTGLPSTAGAGPAVADVRTAKDKRYSDKDMPVVGDAKSEPKP